jgi:hypothetical protein
LGPRRRRFEPCHPDYREVDQLVDRVLWEHEAAGSSPVFPTKYEKRSKRERLPALDAGLLPVRVRSSRLNGLIVQWIEHWSTEPGIYVRVVVRSQIKMQSIAGEQPEEVRDYKP